MEEATVSYPEEDKRRILEAVFGDSDDDGGDEEEEESGTPRLPEPLLPVRRGGDAIPGWEAVGSVGGLWLCRHFLDPGQQSALLNAIQREGWFTEDSHNQAMRFGDLPDWATDLSTLVREVVCFGKDSSADDKEMTVNDQTINEGCPLPLDLLWREPFFDQLIVNRYGPGEGICAHVDLLRFEDGISIISLESSCVMHFTRSKDDPQKALLQAEENGSLIRIPVYLNPGSLVLMFGEARYSWKHEINRKPGFQLWDGKEIHQQRRTSVTLRKLCSSIDS